MKINAAHIKDRYCPDMDSIKDILKLKNGYLNNEDRISFSVEIEKCNSLENPNCKKDAAIQKVLDVLYFTVYYT